MQSNQGTERKKRTEITMDLIKRIRRLLEKNYSAKQVAANEEISLPTAYKFINFISEGLSDQEILEMKKVKTKKSYTEERNKINQLLLRDASFTQRELAAELTDSDLSISQSKISRILKRMKFTRKRLVLVPAERNSSKNLDARQIYAREVENISDGNFLFLDETGLNLHHSRKYGYSPINVKAYKTVKGSRGRNISSLVAIKNSGIVAYQIKEGAFNGDAFITFINEKLIPYYQSNPHDILIMDNCSFHHRHDVITLLNANNISHRFLPPYSPQFNPIEEYFSHMKAVMVSNHALPKSNEELKARIVTMISNDTIDFSGWFRNMRRWLAKALAREEFI